MADARERGALQVSPEVPIIGANGPRVMRILIVDDEALYRDWLVTILSQVPAYQISTAEDGLAAWALLDDPSRFYDVTFLDLSMPKLDGFGLLRRIRESSMLRSLAVIVCTSMKDRDSVGRAAALGVKHYIVKPYTETVVMDKIRQLPTAQGGAIGKLSSEAGARRQNPANEGLSRLHLPPKN
jgi:DNA-binding response OmpR family regulator